MNDALKLQISAFVDGELPDNETELLLRRLSQHAELRAQVASYLAIGRAIRGEQELKVMSQLRGRILAELGESVGESAPAPELMPSRFMRPVVGVAVAASVAVMALVGLRQLGGGVETPIQAYDDLAALAIDDAPSYTEPPADGLTDRPSDLMDIYQRRHRAGSADLESRLATFELRGGELDSDAGDSAEESDEADDVTDSTTTGSGQ